MLNHNIRIDHNSLLLIHPLVHLPGTPRTVRRLREIKRHPARTSTVRSERVGPISFREARFRDLGVGSQWATELLVAWTGQASVWESGFGVISMSVCRGYVSAVPSAVQNAGSVEGSGSAGGVSALTAEHVVRVVAGDPGAAVADEGFEDGDAGYDVA